MQTSHLVILLLFLLAPTISCFPTKPLNERSTELTWQAWLLIDQSQNKQDNSLRRRITPKSVFIAPTFSPESWPACSEGYQSDSMGRCIKIIMLNKELHLDFLLQQLNQKFGGMEDYEEEEKSTSGPLNINIPINAEAEETDVAIVVAPSNGLSQSENESQKKLNKTLSEEKVNVADIAGILGLKKAAEVEITTITVAPTTDQQESTTKNVETTTTNEEGNTTELDALFFLEPKRQVEVKTETSKDATTLLSTTLDIETAETETLKTTTDVKRETSTNPETTTEFYLFQMDQALPYAETLVPFTDTKREAIPSNEFEPNQLPSTQPTTTSLASEKQIDINGLSQHKTDSEKVHTTTTSIIFTPIDNSLSMQDMLQTIQPPSSSTKSYFRVRIKKPNNEKVFSDTNVKFFSSLDESVSKKTQAPESNSDRFISTTEVLTTIIKIV